MTICAWCGGTISSKPTQGKSHGICPDCVRKFFPQFEQKDVIKSVEEAKQ